MTATLAPKRPRRLPVALPRRRVGSLPPVTRPGRSPRGWSWLAFLVLTAVVIVNHGCHSGGHDEDDFSPLWSPRRAPQALGQQAPQTQLPERGASAP
jgi:hypothetical protein